MKRVLVSYLGKSIKRLIVASFIFVLFLPMLFFVYSLNINSWEQVEHTMLQKHLLISKTLVEPFSLFISGRQQSLRTLGQELRQVTEQSISNAHKKKQAQLILDKHLRSFGGFKSLSYAPSESDEIICTATASKIYPQDQSPDYHRLPLKLLPAAVGTEDGQDWLSPAFNGTIDQSPVVLIKHSIFDAERREKGIIYAEISLSEIGKMCSKINFGDAGHCAVVDFTGHVVAHPNSHWVEAVQDLSKVSIVRKMLNGESGTTEFFSPALQANMVAGFSAIPNLGWGVMIPQPKAELTHAMNDLRFGTIIWMVAGVLVAFMVSLVLAHKLTQPINELIQRTRQSDTNGDMVSLGEPPEHTPTEIRSLWQAFSKLLTGLQRSNAEVKRLNVSLQEDIEAATAELREMNTHLYITSTQDYLTSLSNRRHFTQYLEQKILQEPGIHIGIMIIDIDKFKPINDHYGHEAGDLALVKLANILKDTVRPGDLAARLGGDEFIVYVDNPSHEVLAGQAETIRQRMLQSPLQFEQDTLSLTLSIGIVRQANNGDVSVKTLLRHADQAMYQSKASGRNKVSVYPPDTAENPKQALKPL